MLLFMFFCFVVVVIQGSSSANDGKVPDECKESFPKIIVQAVDVHSREGKCSVLATNLCTPEVLIEGATAENSTIASYPGTSTVCYQPPGENEYNRFICAINGKITFASENSLDTGSQERRLLHFDPYGQNLYSQQRIPNGNWNMIVTDASTTVSKYLWNDVWPFTYVEIDAIHGIAFYAVRPYSEMGSLSSLWWMKMESSVSSGVIFSRDAGMQTGLAIDWQEQQVYYGYDNSIVRMDYDGRNQEIFNFDPAENVKPSIVPGTIKYFETHLYFLRGNASLGYSLCKFHWASKKEVNRYTGLKQKEVRHMQIYETFTTKENPCNELKCSHLCLPTYKSRIKCDCPSFMELDVASGNTCQGPSLTILVEKTPEASLAAFGHKSIEHMTKHSVLFVNGSQLGLPNTPVEVEFSEVDGAFGLVAAFENNVNCFKRRTGEYKCLKEGNETFGTDPWQYLDAATVSERRIIGANFAVNGNFIILNNRTKCVELLNAETGNLWNSRCSPELTSNSNLIAADPRYVQLTSVSKAGSRVIRHTHLFVNSSLVVSDRTVDNETETTGNLYVDPETHTMLWKNGDKIYSSEYNGRDPRSIAVPNAKSFLGGLSYSRGRMYWVEAGTENKQYLVTYNTTMVFTERIFEADASVRILAFSVGRRSDTVYDCWGWDNKSCPRQLFNNPCRNANCSHGCIPDPSLKKVPLCFCPPGLVLLNKKKCTTPAFLVALRVRSSNEIRLKAVPKTQTSKPFQGLDLKLDDAQEQASIDVCSSGDQWTACWIANKSRVVCRSSKIKTISTLGHTVSSQPFLKLSEECDRVYWRYNDDGCFKVTTLRNNKTFSFPCVQSLGTIRSSLIAVDTERSVLFWCQNDEISYMPIVDEGPHPPVALDKVYNGTTETRQCSAIALNIRTRELIIFYGNSLLAVGYKVFKNNALEPNSTSMSIDKASSAEVGQFSHADGGTLWVGTKNDVNVIYFVPDYSMYQGEGLDADSVSRAGAIGQPWVLYEANASESIIALQMLLGNGSDTSSGNLSPCKTHPCPGLCYETDITGRDSKVNCKMSRWHRQSWQQMHATCVSRMN